MKNKKWILLIVAGLAIGLGITLFSPWASGSPDGLERVAEDEGFAEEGKDPTYQVIADYVLPGVENERLSTVLAGMVGVVMVMAVSLGAGAVLYAVARRRESGASATQEQTGAPPRSG